MKTGEGFVLYAIQFLACILLIEKFDFLESIFAVSKLLSHLKQVTKLINWQLIYLQ